MNFGKINRLKIKQFIEKSNEFYWKRQGILLKKAGDFWKKDCFLQKLSDFLTNKTVFGKKSYAISSKKRFCQKIMLFFEDKHASF